MKFASALIAVTFAFVGFTAHAADAQGAQQVLTCSVPVTNAASQVALTLSVVSDTSKDFVLIQVNDKGQSFQMFTQADKGSIASGVAAGNIGFLALDENFSSDVGVIRNAGFFVAQKNAQGAFEGMLAAHGNVYPLSCQAH